MALDDLYARAREYGRRIRDAEPGALARWVVWTWEYAPGHWSTGHCRDASLLAHAEAAGVPADVVASFRGVFLDGRGDGELVYVMITADGTLGARTFAIDAPN
ncbi:MAG: hypothetical protein KF795_00625 [Labilithrix sp.]|nr:hypothetical protein [Labilithrix sp.]